MTPALDAALRELARAPTLLVASDYDGTLAPIVADPAAAEPLPEAAAALRALITLPQTHAALISGRSLRDLAALARLPADVHMVGSHGSEFDFALSESLTPEQIGLRQQLFDAVTEIAAAGEGLLVETKPAGVALHYRRASPEVARRAREAVEAGPATWPGVHVRGGKMVVELSVMEANKGTALLELKRRVGASAVIFFGDDVTDEDAFAVLGPGDVGVKVGPGDTRAGYRLDAPQDVVPVLARLFELRAAWFGGTEYVPIEQHAVLSDHRTAALVTPDARIVWLCLPRLDSPAIFAELLGGPDAGYFAIRPVDGGPATQRYLDDTLVLETRFPNITISDFLDCSGGRPLQRAGRSDLVRIVEGRGRVRIEFAPRLDFGRVPTGFEPREGGLVVTGSHEPIVLRAPGVQWTFEDHGHHRTAIAEIELAGTAQVFELVHGSTATRRTGPEPIGRFQATVDWWRTWVRGLRVPAIEPDLVRRSALLLKSLFYESTGAFVAAATTSLPETIGGVRNWDYRYCWLRDAALSAASLVRLGSTSEAMRYLDWVLNVIDRSPSPDRLHPLYTVTGSALGAEATIPELAGYRGSRPVRIGNAAAMQLQLDVFGPIVDLVALLAAHHAPLSGAHWRLVQAMVDAVAARWHEPDYGIWEIRKPRRHHVHSKVMCWLTVHRGLDIADHLLEVDRPDWRELRDRIAADVLTNGYDAAAGNFKAAYDGTDIDAAALHVGLSGLLPPDDPRFLGTVAAVERDLLDGPVVFRYRSDDGLPGLEGGFHLCTSWFIRALLLVGRTDDAHALFRRMVELVGPTGLLPEQYDPSTGTALGNTPQAYSHLGLIDCAVALQEAG